MFAKRFLAILVSMCVALCTAVVSFADMQDTIKQVHFDEQTAYIYISGDFDAENLSCYVSGEKADILQKLTLADGGFTVCTTYLVDVSRSIPTEMRDDVLDFLFEAFKQKPSNEVARLMTFGDEDPKPLVDFTTNSILLGEAVNPLDETTKIQFDNKQSKLYDAIFKTISKTQYTDDKPCYYHTVVITDGADHTQTGFTDQELTKALEENNNNNIDIVAVSNDEQKEPLKELTYLTNQTAGSYVNLHANADKSDLIEKLRTEDVMCLQISIPKNMLNGDVRPITIIDGTNKSELRCIFPTYISTDAELNESAAENVTVEAVESEEDKDKDKDKDKDDEDEDEDDDKDEAFSLEDFLDEYLLYILIGAGALILIIVLIIIIVSVAGKKKRNSAAADTQDPHSNERDRDDYGTIYVMEDDYSGGSSNLQISIKNVNDPNQNWSLNLSNGIVVGRERGCQLFIDEGSMSRQQCRLYVGANGTPMIENLSRTNITRLNGNKLEAPMKLEEDDIIKCGNVSLRVVAIYGAIGSYMDRTIIENV